MFSVRMKVRSLMEREHVLSIDCNRQNPFVGKSGKIGLDTRRCIVTPSLVTLPHLETLYEDDNRLFSNSVFLRVYFSDCLYNLSWVGQQRLYSVYFDRR